MANWHGVNIVFVVLHQVVTSDYGLSVLWDGESNFQVVIPPSFHGKVCGLLGNFDGNPNNDLIKPDGIAVSLFVFLFFVCFIFIALRYRTNMSKESQWNLGDIAFMNGVPGVFAVVVRDGALRGH